MCCRMKNTFCENKYLQFRETTRYFPRSKYKHLTKRKTYITDCLSGAFTPSQIYSTKKPLHVLL